MHRNVSLGNRFKLAKKRSGKNQIKPAFYNWVYSNENVAYCNVVKISIKSQMSQKFYLMLYVFSLHMSGFIPLRTTILELTRMLF